MNRNRWKRSIRLASKGVCADGGAIAQDAGECKDCRDFPAYRTEAGREPWLTEQFHPTTIPAKIIREFSTMRIRTFLLATVAAGCLTFGAEAAEVDAKGAEALQKSILSYLPEKAAATGFIEVTPEKDHYRFAVDFGKLVHALVPAKEFDLSLVYDGLIFPPSTDGLYPVRRDASDVTMSARWEKGPEKGNISYLFKGLAFEGLYDPAITYFRDFTARGTGGSFSSDAGPQKLDGSFGPYEQGLNSTANADGSINASMTGSIAGFRENVKDDKGMSASFSGETANLKASFSAFKVKEITEIVKFISAKANQEKLEAADKQQLSSLVAGAMPLFGAFDETLTAGNMAIEAGHSREDRQARLFCRHGWPEGRLAVPLRLRCFRS